MRKYGVENFSFEILEDGIEDINILNEKEQAAIIKYDSTSHKNGYNIALGGDGGAISYKLTPNQINEIINLLADENNLQSFNEIGELFNVSGSAIQDINCGDSWFSPNILYPIRKYNTAKLSITREQYKHIIEDIKTSPLSLGDIAKKYNISNAQLTAIN